jgi:hypothetical protein
MGMFKKYIYMDKIQDLNHLKLKEDMLQLVWQGVEYQLEKIKIMFRTIYIYHF